MYGEAPVHPTVTKFLLLVEGDSQLRTMPVSAIAKVLGISVSHLQHLVRHDIGKTCTEIIRARWVREMEAYLREHPALTISEVAYRCGCDPRTMYRLFTEVLGLSPSAVRKQ